MAVLIRQTDAAGNDTLIAYDALGRQTSTTDRIGGVTVMGYDADSHLLTLTDAEGQTTAYTYDTVGNKLTKQYPDHVTGTSPGQIGYGIVTHTYDGLHRNRDRIDQQGVIRQTAFLHSGSPRPRAGSEPQQAYGFPHQPRRGDRP